MTATASVISYGTTLGLGDGASPEVFTAILEVFEFSGVKSKRPQVDASNLTSPNQTKEYVAGMIDPESCTFKVRLIPGNEVIIKNWYDAGLRSNWKLTKPGSLVARYFSATPESWAEMGFVVSGLVEGEVGFKIAGAIR